MHKTSAFRLLLAAALLAPAAASAHGGAPHDHAPAQGAKKRTPAPVAQPATPDHEHPPPHGGQVVDVAADLHVEVVFAPPGVAVYFYDGDMKPLPPPADGKLTLVVGKQTQKLALAPEAPPAPQDRVVAPATLPQDGKVIALVQATVGGKARTARVERAAAPAPAAAASVP